MNAEQQTEGVQGQRYRIVVAGELDPSWSTWLDGLEISAGQMGEEFTILRGVIPDQAALRGILNKIWDLRLTLVSVAQESLESNTRR